MAFAFMIGILALRNLCPREIKNIQYRIAGLIIVFCLLSVTMHLIRLEPGAFRRTNIYRFMFRLGGNNKEEHIGCGADSLSLLLV